jgi:hypothetical protein
MNKHMDLLHIYDPTAAIERTDADLELAVKGAYLLSEELDKLLVMELTFKRVVITCHGSPGLIRFDGNDCAVEQLKTYFANKQHYRLFPLPTRMYFNGCQVGAEEKGWQFLETAGKIFLRQAGGTVFAHTTDGYLANAWGIFTSLGMYAGSYGHVVHDSDDDKTRYVTIGPGGAVIKRFENEKQQPIRYDDATTYGQLW